MSVGVFPFTKVVVAVTVGAGAGVPLVTASTAASSELATEYGIGLDGKAVNSEGGNWGTELDGWVIPENRLSPAEQRNSEALDKLDQKNCKQIKNPAFAGAWFGALWICRDSTKDENGYSSTDFYYLDKDRSDDLEWLYSNVSAISPLRRVSSANSEDLVKKIVSVKYNVGSVKGENVLADKGGAHLTLGLERGGEQKLEVPVESIWKNFNGENPSDSCKVGTMSLGGDLLWCQLTDSDGTKDSGGKAHYYFSIT